MTTRRLRLVVIAAMWAAVLGLWWWVQRRAGLGPAGELQHLVDALRARWWAAAAYLMVSVLRPFVFVPATLMTVAAGILFGAGPGTMLAVVGANAAAMVALELGAILDPSRGRGADVSARFDGWRAALTRNSFEAVLLMRLLALPYDLVAYGCGAAGVRRRPFLAATAIGSFPSTVAIVLVGASITRLDQGVRGLDRRTLAVSVAVKVAGLLVAVVVRRARRPVLVEAGAFKEQ